MDPYKRPGLLPKMSIKKIKKFHRKKQEHYKNSIPRTKNNAKLLVDKKSKNLTSQIIYFSYNQKYYYLKDYTKLKIKN